jgi:putative transposase
LGLHGVGFPTRRPFQQGIGVPKVYHELVYHFAWSTKDRLPLITSEVEAHLLPFIERKCDELGYHVYAVNCVEDHLHLLVRLKPTDSVSELARQLKGSSSHFINKELQLEDVLYWQTGYAVLSLREKDVPIVTRYIQRQKQRHATTGGLIAKLERLEDG